MIDPRDHHALWLLLRCTGGTDAWLHPLDDPDAARCERVTSVVTAVLTIMVVGAVAAAVLTEVLRTWA